MVRGGGRRGGKGAARPVEVAISRNRAPEDAHPKTRFFTVDFGGNLIYTTYARKDADVARWISDARRIERERRRGGLFSLGDVDGTVLVGARLFRGVTPSWAYIRDHARGTTAAAPPAEGKKDRAVELISLCVAGNHCLVIELRGNGGPSSYDRRNFPRPLREFLADRFVCVVAVGARPGAATLHKDWGVHVEWPVDLRELFLSAFGREALPRRRGGGGGDADLLREMGRLALGAGMDAGERPAGFEKGFWNSPLRAEDVKYAAVDAFLSYKVAEKSLEARGAGNPGLG